MKSRRCNHATYLKMNREADRCYWLRCGCGFTGPKKSSYNTAMMAFMLKRELQHPRLK